jgi:small-conductance mechanosensitive channel
VASLLVGFAFNRIFHGWRVKAQSRWGELFLAMLESLSVPLSLLAAVCAAIEFLVLPRQYEQIGAKAIFAFVVVLVFHFLTRIVNLFVVRWGRREPSLIRDTQPISFMVRVLFALLAAIIIFENLGINLTAVWTTLGVGSVAVALALQDTLGNFFAGVYLLADRPIRPGDYIKMDAGQEGIVVSVGWRSASLRTLGNNLVVVPNSTLAKAVIINYSMPQERLSLDIRVSVPYGIDARRVEQVLVDLAEQAGRDQLDGLHPDFSPEAKLIPGFGPSSLDFTLSVKVRKFVDQFPVQSELRKRILERFQQEGIAMADSTPTFLLKTPAPISSPEKVSLQPRPAQKA